MEIIFYTFRFICLFEIIIYFSIDWNLSDSTKHMGNVFFMINLKLFEVNVSLIIRATKYLNIILVKSFLIIYFCTRMKFYEVVAS